MSRRTSAAHALGRGSAAVLAIWLWCLSMLAVGFAPLLMPDSYSWVEHTISESAGQGVQGAWMARSGLYLAALAMLTLAGVAGERWGFWGRSALRLYAFGLIAAAIFSRAPWTDVPYDHFEGYLHTISVFWAGVGFALGVLLVRGRRGPGPRWVRASDLTVFLITLVVPVLMLIFRDQEGLLQRFLALAGYIWVIAEATRVGRNRPAVPDSSSDLTAPI
jgi:Protein of unknown function (DUF998)